MAPAPPIRTSFHYGWMVVAVSFVTIGIAVNSRTSFSLLYPPILAEFGWDRGVTAAAFSIGFFSSTVTLPFIGLMIDRAGPRYLMALSAVLVAGGFVGVTLISTPLGLYLTIGVLSVGAIMPMTYIGHSMFLPNWFTRRRGLAIGIAFSGVGILSVFMFPALQLLIETHGWRSACLVMAAACVVILLPLNLLLQRGHPREVGQTPYGDAAEPAGGSKKRTLVVVDETWASREWTIASAMRTGRFWWLAAGFFFGLIAWYTVQVHQTRYLIDIGIDATEAAFALGLVGLTGVIGQIGIGALSDRIGREWAFTLSMSGFVACYGLLILLAYEPSRALMYLMVSVQGILGYGLASLYGPIQAEIFAGKRVGSIIGVLSVASNIGAGLGPWFAGAVYDKTGSYEPAFASIIVLCLLSIIGIWMASPRKVRRIAIA